MHVIARPLFIEAQQNYPNDAAAIDDLYKVLCKCEFATPVEMQQVFGSLDNFKHKAGWYVIDIGGHNLRLIAAIRFPPLHHCLYAKAILTHAEYDKFCRRAARRDWNGEI